MATVWTFTETEFRHCATLSGFYGDDEMAEKSMALARYYNTAIIANENTLGITSHLKNYPELYYRTDPVTGSIAQDSS